MKINKPKTLAVLIISAGLMFLSCATTGTSASRSADRAPDEKQLTLADLRPDITAVVTALAGEMLFPEGEQGNLVFFREKPAVAPPVPEEGFSLSDIYLEEDYQPGDDPLVRRISGLMRLSDSLGREDYRSFAAEYLVQDEAILVLTAAAGPVYGRFDRVRFFFVEKNELPPLSYLESADYKELLPLVAKNAYPPQEIRNTGGMMDFYLFAFDMTRGEKKASLMLHTDGTVADVAVNSAESVNSGGWRFVMLDGMFRLGEGADYSFYVTETKDPERVMAAMKATLDQ